MNEIDIAYIAGLFDGEGSVSYYQHKEQVKKYRLKNRDKMREYNRQYAIKNKEKKKAYRLKTREHARQWQRNYYQKNKQDIKIKRYYKAEARA